MDKIKHPIAIIGAGPVGLAAAAHLLSRGLTPLILEAGKQAGASINEWGHVKMFSPWRFNIDKEAERLLITSGWTTPQPDAYPTGQELLGQYIQPLSKLPEIEPYLHLNSRVLAVSRVERDVMKTQGRNSAPFLLRVAGSDGERDVLASAVIDASGTYATPNWMGAHGIPALGEKENSAHIAYGIPDILGSARHRYSDRHVLVVGAGHSAFNALQDLVALARIAPGTRVLWAIRSTSLERILGGGKNDQLEQRGKLGLKIRQLLDEGAIELHQGIRIHKITSSPKGIIVHSMEQALPPVDEIVVATGFRPNLELMAELRLALDPATGSPVKLAPLIDPNEHSCGTVRPHGVQELAHPDEGVFITGMKSYGRAPTFLMLTGYEQVRSIAAALAGDWDSARRSELVLPETGVCSTQFLDVIEQPTGCRSTTACSSASAQEA
ncbi:FAD-dependent oxidoreductase [Allopusillimonas soli]|uniref:FAD-dependent oxidoreductase n=1 Tax=Allopusillimonas soli TaxID=659016 RepID=A0A853F8R8_9BURK|nr:MULTISPECIES: NAD(P)-binding domain-containing protein [Alcaligenaceae]MCC2597802.1 NAD(P)-binding domain-containing protein [Pusillimonas sp. MFBS29]NYT36377.1 FAD-dependent oxidoreductase [Allopusillimonas soli]TEA76693.1 FAD-dependent oxidoreductase [Allopusillimonas soli]